MTRSRVYVEMGSILKRSLEMELKDSQIGILIEDQTLRRMLYDLLVRSGARVSCLGCIEELELLSEKLGIEIVVMQVQTRYEPFCLN